MCEKMTVTCPVRLQWSEEKKDKSSVPDPPLTKADRFPLVFRVSIVSSTIWNRLQCGGTVNNTAFYLNSGMVTFLKSTRRWQHWPAVHALIRDHRQVLFQKHRGSDDLTDDPDQVQEQPNNSLLFDCLHVLRLQSLLRQSAPVAPATVISSCSLFKERDCLVWCFSGSEVV